jgi:hypothetical protein
MKMTPRVVLTGGLGNQLFKYAYALHLSKKLHSRVWLSQGLGVPRSTIPGKADIDFYQLNEGIEIENPRFADPIRRKFLNFIHVKTLRHNESLASNNINRIYKFFTSIILSILDIKISRISVSDDLGFVEISRTGHSRYHIGYFQTYRYLADLDLVEQLRNLELRFVGPELSALIEESKIEKPLILHVRLTDYLLHPSFGTVGPDYYERALNEAKKDFDFERIWVFSDDITMAKSKLQFLEEENVRFIAEVDNSPTATLEAMRLGYSFIIANSTFSWWSAMLSRNPSAKVIAPEPWFSSMKDPKDLIPPNWLRISREHK